MHPAPSIIAFTVLSGIGFGLAAWLGLGLGPEGPVGLAGILLALVLASIGLSASVLHLARPSAAWRAFSQWRSSWLSREGVFSVLALGSLALHGLLLWGGIEDVVFGPLAAVLSLATLFATSMIYAQLRSVPVWATRLTPAAFVLFALAGGGLIVVTLGAFAGTAWRGVAIAALLLLVAAWAAKWHWWRRSARLARVSPGTATGLATTGGVRAFEPPHTGRNYLIDEMAYRVARRRAGALRRLALGLGAMVPAILVLVALVAPGGAVALLGLAVLSHTTGLLAERWLFFAEAQHVQSAFYGDRTPLAAARAV